MRNNNIGTNRMSKTVYIILSLLLNLLLAILFFRFLYNEKLFKFEGLFSIIYCICIAFGLAITYRKNRSIKSAVFVVIVPFGIYLLVAYNSTWTIISSMILLISFIYLCVQTFRKPIPKKKDKNLIFIIRTKKLIRTSHSMLGFYSSVLVITAIIASLLSGSPLAENTNVRNQEKHSLIDFSLDDWECANAETKLIYAQKIIDYECEQLDTIPLSLIASSEMSQDRLASYSDKQGKITINQKHLNNDSILEVINSLCHESRHAWQYSFIYNCKNYEGKEKIDKKMADMCSALKVEFTDYVSYSSKDTLSDYYSYMFQECEQDSRQYADAQSKTLYSIILSNSY